MYSPAGAVTSLVLGNSYVYESRSYTSRLQPSELKVGSWSGGSDRLDLTTYYCASQGSGCAGDNGNLMSLAQTTHSGTALNTGYTYDAVNRLLSATEAASGSGQSGWAQTYGYDQYGNRMRTDGGSTSMLTPGPGALFPSNRWDWQGTGCAACYDGAGNQLTQAGSRSFTYDAENRMVTATEPQGTSGTMTTTYQYDGDGRRVTKTVGSGATAVATTYAYYAMGELAVEYGGSVTGTGTRYLSGDFLGSTRLVMDPTVNSNSGIVECLDYVPFGEEIASGVKGRPVCNSTGSYPAGSPDLQPTKFTGKERDAETGLDFFGARYMSAAQGRFTSPDPSNLSVDFWLPQTWNRYSYALNNPLAYVDENGLWPTWIHNQIIRQAFPGLTEAQLQALVKASHDTDYVNRVNGLDPQDPAASFVHGMTDGLTGQSAEDAERR